MRRAWALGGGAALLGVVWLGVQQEQLSRQLDRQGEQITLLKRQLAQQAGAGGDSSGRGAASVTERALGQNCAFELVRDLQEYWGDNQKYPDMSQITLPAACQGMRVDWTRLEKTAYSFVVQNQEGQELARDGRS